MSVECIYTVQSTQISNILAQHSLVQQSQEEEDYLAWLSGKEGSKLTERERREMDALKNYWNDPHIDQDEAFLRDYILNKGYMDKDTVRWM